ncbi:hypothetical protein RCH07_000221 [Arthrobacter sp. CG_A4]|nr:hypothetical protein [Arthrobacter sp. CG_A4]
MAAICGEWAPASWHRNRHPQKTPASGSRPRSPDVTFLDDTTMVSTDKMAHAGTAPRLEASLRDPAISLHRIAKITTNAKATRR